MPVDDAVVVGVHAGAQEGRADQRAVGVALLLGPGELHVLGRVAQAEPVGGVPVVLAGRRRGVDGGLRLAGVDDRAEPEDQDDHDDQREERPALEADALALALLRQAGGAVWVEDEETTSARRLSARVAGPPSVPTPARRSAARRPRRRPPVTPRRAPSAGPARPSPPRVPGSSTSRADGGGEGVHVIGRHRHPGAGRGEDARHLGAGVDRRRRRVGRRRGSSRSSTARSTDPSPAAQRHGVDVTRRQQLDEPVVGHVAGEADVGEARGAGFELRPRRRRRR